MRWTSQQCNWIIGALLFIVIYLGYFSNQSEGTRAASMVGVRYRFIVYPAGEVAKMGKQFGVKGLMGSVGWCTEPIGCLGLVPADWKTAYDEKLSFEIKGDKTEVSLSEHGLGTFYTTPRGYVARSGSLDTPVRLKAIPHPAGWGYALQDLGSGMLLGFTNKFLYRSYDTKDDVIPLTSGDFKDPGFYVLNFGRERF